MSIEPTAVYSPGTSPAAQQQQSSGQQGRVYVIHQPPDDQPYGGGQGNVLSRNVNRIPAQKQSVNTSLSNSLPKWLKGSVSNRAIVFNMWLIAMILVSFDEWHNLGILPRPARLWDTSLLYGLLVIAGFVDVAVPIANMLAIGFTISLLIKYFQGGITPGGSTKTTPTTGGGGGGALKTQ